MLTQHFTDPLYTVSTDCFLNYLFLTVFLQFICALYSVTLASFVKLGLIVLMLVLMKLRMVPEHFFFFFGDVVMPSCLQLYLEIKFKSSK